MRRVVAMVLGLGLVTAVALVVTLSLRGSDDGSSDTIVMPYPRTSKPLPVPEVRIGSGPWADSLPAAPPPSAELRTCRTTDGPYQQRLEGRERPVPRRLVCQPK